MSIRGNFRGVKPNGDAFGGKFPLVPEGEYLVVVKRVEEVTSSGGNPMVKTRYMILDDGEQNGRLLFDQIVFCEKMAGRNKHVLKVLEQPFEEGPDDDELIIEPDDWMGKQLRVAVIHEEYPVGSGTLKPKISQYLYKSEEAKAAAHAKGDKKNKPKPATAGTRKQDPPAGDKPAPAQENAGEEFPEGGDDEIPF